MIYFIDLYAEIEAFPGFGTEMQADRNAKTLKYLGFTTFPSCLSWMHFLQILYYISLYLTFDVFNLLSFCFLKLRTFVATWNVGGKPPENSLVLDDFLQLSAPSDIYVLG